jgi:hypothetical protein
MKAAAEAGFVPHLVGRAHDPIPGSRVWAGSRPDGCAHVGFRPCSGQEKGEEKRWQRIDERRGRGGGSSTRSESGRERLIGAAILRQLASEVFFMQIGACRGPAQRPLWPRPRLPLDFAFSAQGDIRCDIIVTLV